MRRPSAWNFASRSPTRIATGIVSSPKRSHSGSHLAGADTAQRRGDAFGTVAQLVGAGKRVDLGRVVGKH